MTLLLMGGCTSLIGLLPTYASIGIAAPALLLLLRILQGVSAGGEWGGAVLMAVEHSDPRHRGRVGSYPQLGVPLGLMLASGVMALMTGVLSPGPAFEAWGWRVPFLLSIVLMGVGYVVRRMVDESPVFVEISTSKQQTRRPVSEVIAKYWHLILLGTLIFAGNNAAGYMTTGGFITKFATSNVGMDTTAVLLAVAVGSIFWFFATLAAGELADRIGRVRTYQIGYVWLDISVFVIFPMIMTASLEMLYLALLIYAVGLGLTYGPQSALYAEMFPASVRYSGVSISYALGAVLGGAFAPFIAQAILGATHRTLGISIYLCAVVVIAFVAVSVVRDRRGIDLSVHNEGQGRNAVHDVWHWPKAWAK